MGGGEWVVVSRDGHWRSCISSASGVHKSGGYMSCLGGDS